jgi:uncharacterized protein YcfL
MKKMLFIFTTAVIFTACKSKTNSELTHNKNMVLVDTTGLSKSNVLTDVGNNKYVINDKAIFNANESKSAASTKEKSKSSVNNTGSNNSGGDNNTAVAKAPVKQDKGWSHAAKATAVGAGTGAIFGAIVNKEHRGQGALIGTVVGAGTGYIIGRATDKKTGRVARAKARKAANQ